MTQHVSPSSPGTDPLQVQFIVPRCIPDEGCLALVTARVATPPLTRIDAFVTALTHGLTQWSTQTTEGQRAWTQSSHDFNVGDLDHVQSIPSLILFLQHVGITNLTIELHPYMQDLQSWQYDTVLIDPAPAPHPTDSVE